jgi:hypothetical protein
MPAGRKPWATGRQQKDFMAKGNNARKEKKKPKKEKPKPQPGTRK